MINTRAENLRAKTASAHAALDKLVGKLSKEKTPIAYFWELVSIRHALEQALADDDKAKEAESKP